VLPGAVAQVFVECEDRQAVEADSAVAPEASIHPRFELSRDFDLRRRPSVAFPNDPTKPH